MIEINGALGEGGGQLVRTALALAALSGEEVRIYNVRAKRSPPGLRPQHLVGVKAIATLSNAEVKGLRVGSKELIFRPRRISAGSLRFNIGTAGSISLVLQALMPVAAFAPSEVNLLLIGGTNVRWSPPIDYLTRILLPSLAKMGYEGEIRVLRRGHYPRGGGRVLARLFPVRKLRPIILDQLGNVQSIRGISYCVRLPKHVAERQARAAMRRLEEAGYRNVQIETEWYPPASDPHLDPGSGVTLCAEASTGAIIGADSMGELGKPAEVVGREAADKLLEELRTGMPVDRHLGDMLIPYMAVADGRSLIKVSSLTLHTITNIMIAELIVGVKFEVEGGQGFPATISVRGSGLSPLSSS